jgi:catechol 2,3-dioxygenase-like lactoylglutathione lyase family enzyme
MKVRGIDHVGVVVADLERSLRFYRDLLGIRVLQVVDDDSDQLREITGWSDQRVLIADLDLGDGRLLELIERPQADPRPEGDTGMHVAIVVDDIEAVWTRLTEAGVPTRSRPVTLHDAGPRWNGVAVAYVSDPDGVTVELVQAVGRT